MPIQNQVGDPTLSAAAYLIKGYERGINRQPQVTDLCYLVAEILQSQNVTNAHLYIAEDGELSLDGGSEVLTVEVTRGTSDFIRLVDSDGYRSGQEAVTPTSVHRRLVQMISEWVDHRLGE